MKIHAARTMQFALNILHGHQNQRRKGEINGKSIFRILSQSTQFKAFRRHSWNQWIHRKRLHISGLGSWTGQRTVSSRYPRLCRWVWRFPYCRQYLCKPAANCRASGGRRGEKCHLKLAENRKKPHSACHCPERTGTRRIYNGKYWYWFFTHDAVLLHWCRKVHFFGNRCG